MYTPVAIYVATLNVAGTQLVVSCCPNQEELLVHVRLVGKFNQANAVKKKIWVYSNCMLEQDFTMLRSINEYIFSKPSTFTHLKAASFWSRWIVWSVLPWMGSITLTKDAHMPGPALAAPKTASGRSSDSSASAILSATSASSSPAASLNSLGRRDSTCYSNFKLLTYWFQTEKDIPG